MSFITAGESPEQSSAREAELREIRERFNAVFNHAPIGMALVSTTGEFLMVNEALCGLVGYSEQDLLQASFQGITHPHDLEADLAYVEQMLEGQRRSYQMEKRYLHAEGHIVWVLLSVSLVHDAEANPLYFVSQIMDITERKAQEDELRAAASTDPLTGLMNRRAFEEALDRQLAFSIRHGSPGALVLIDIDGFKAVNDQAGHHTGDELLQEIAETLAEAVRTSDVVARVGGDEFAAILGEASAQRASEVATRMVEAVGRVVVPDERGEEIGRSISAGVAAFDGGAGHSARELLIAADQAMYRAKAAGGGRWQRHAGD
jgi:diguanylate cyclase (GGDEF)-like protein/PAS domain S-box-containing protein